MIRFVRFTVFVFVLILSSACVQQLPPVEDAGSHSVRLVLDGGVEPYEADNTKAASALTWKAGDVIYVRTETSAGVNTSYAEYGSDGAWTFNYTGALRTASKVQCYYFEKPKSTGVDQVTLSYTSAIYEDNAATMTVADDGTVTLSTYLKPKTGRISFHGNSKAITVSGLSWYSSFSLKDFTFTESVNANVKTFTASATNYFYGFFAEENTERDLYVTNEKIVFKRSFGTNVLRAGASGYVDVPTHESFDGWTVTNEEELARYQPIVIEDANFEAWLINRGYDTDGDGEISVAEGERVREIVIDGNETIQSLKGIESFPNLVKLHVTGTNEWVGEKQKYVGKGLLTSIDVSKNTKLTELNLDNNQISTLDISHNSSLLTLSLYANKLTSLDLNGGESLTYLNVVCNELTSLDLSSFVSLRQLECHYNELNSLNVSACHELERLDVERNHLTSLDVSSLTALRDLICSYNQLDALDVTTCPDLRSLALNGNGSISAIDVSHCPLLTYLLFGDTSISSIDLSNCPNLQTLWCSGCKLSSLDVSLFRNLENLYCGFCGLTSLDLSNNPELRYLQCVGNQLTYLDLSSCNKLNQVDCMMNNLTELDVTGLPELIDLSCGQNDFSMYGLDLSGNPKLRYLWCNDDNLYSLDVSSNPLLEQLGCYSNNLTTLDVYSNQVLWYLNCTNNPDLATVIVKKDNVPGEIYYDGITELVYEE